MKKVILISLLPLTRVGGGERYTLDTYRSISVAGDQVRLFFLTSDATVRPGVEQRLKTPCTERKPDGSEESLTFYDLLLQLASADTIVLHQYLASGLVFDIIASVCQDQQLVLTNLGDESILEDFQAFYQPAHHHRFVEISDAALCGLHHFKGRAAAVSAGIWSDCIHPVSLPKDPSALVAVGRVLPHKGFEVTIDALPGNLSLRIIGPDSLDAKYREFLGQRCAGKRVAFTGVLKEADKNAVIASSRCLIASSTRTLYDGRVIPQAELLGLIIFEALSYRTIPIVSDIPSYAEIMHKLQLTRFVYRERDSGDLCRVIAETLRLSASEEREWIDQAVEAMRAQFLWDDYWLRVKPGLPAL